MKVLAVAFITALLFLLLAGTLIVGEVQAATEFGGIITSDTTWTKANSPYNLTGNVLIESGVTLTIEADTTLNFNEYFIRVNGSLVIQPGVTLNIETVVGGGSIQVHGLINMRGTSTNPIHVNGGTYYYAWIAPPSYSSIVFSQQSIPWNEQTASGCIIENVVLSSTNIVVNNSPKITKNTFLDNGGVTVSIGSPEISNSNVYGRIEINGGSPVIASNNVKNGQIVYHTDYDGDYVTIIDNVVSYAMGQSGSTAIRIIGGSFNGGHVLIEGNLITNSDVGIDIFDPNTAYTDTSVNIQNNTIVNNIVGLSIGDRFSPIIAGNNIYDNPTSIKLYADASNDIDATYNWWGTTDNQGIEQSIIDFKEDFDLGKVTYDPFLAEPNSKAPSLTYFPVTPPLPTDSPTPTIEPTPTVEPTPSGEPTPTPEPTPTSTLTAAPTSPPIELNLLETAILIVLVVIATLLVAIIWLVMKKRR